MTGSEPKVCSSAFDADGSRYCGIIIKAICARYTGCISEGAETIDIQCRDCRIEVLCDK